MNITCKYKQHQQGAVLIVSLIILLLMTLIGVSGMQTTTLEEKMAGNNLDRQIALQAAEAAVIEGEGIVNLLQNQGQLGAYDINGADGRYDGTGGAFPDIWKLVDWDGTNGGNTNKALPYTGADASLYSVSGAPPPKFVIEHYATAALTADIVNQCGYGDCSGAGQMFMFRITARGTSRAGSGQVVLQTVFGKKL